MNGEKRRTPCGGALRRILAAALLAVFAFFAGRSCERDHLSPEQGAGMRVTLTLYDGAGGRPSLPRRPRGEAGRAAGPVGVPGQHRAGGAGRLVCADGAGGNGRKTVG